jgi:hypothetical protein
MRNDLAAAAGQMRENSDMQEKNRTIASAILAAVCAFATTGASADVVRFEFPLSGDQEVPAVTTTGSGNRPHGIGCK